MMLFETGCAKWIRFHDVPKPQFTSNRDQATRIYESGGVSDEYLKKILSENKLDYLMKTIKLDFDIVDESGRVSYSMSFQELTTCGNGKASKEDFMSPVRKPMSIENQKRI